VNGTAASRRQCLAFRITDVSNYWRIAARGTSGDTTYSLQKVVSGTATTIATCAVAPANLDVIRAEFTGDVIGWWINSILISLVTDSALDTNTKHGLQGEFSTDDQARFDDFKVWIG
jgi:hypothetical protein